MPLITSEQVPQIPSRQSESNTIGSSPRAISRSLSTSSISRKDMSGLTSGASYSTNPPRSCPFFWRQMRSFRFICSSVASCGLLRKRAALCGAPAAWRHPDIPTLTQKRNGHHPVSLRRRMSGILREKFQTSDGEARRDDAHFAFVSAWEYQGAAKPPALHKEPLVYEEVHMTQRSYK